MTLHYWERHAAFLQALGAAQDALTAVERLEASYYATVTRPHQPKAYVQAEHERNASALRHRVLNEATEAVEHLSDAIRAWWDVDRPDWTDRG